MKTNVIHMGIMLGTLLFGAGCTGTIIDNDMTHDCALNYNTAWMMTNQLEIIHYLPETCPVTPFYPTDVGATINETDVVYPGLHEALYMTGAAFHEFDFDTYTPSWITSNGEEAYFQWVSRNSVMHWEAATYLSITAYDNDDYGVFEVVCQGGFNCSDGPPWPMGVLTIEWDF